MKKLVASAAAAVLLSGLLFSLPSASSQAPTARESPHKVGLIDMAHIFKNYKKFEVLREDLKSEILAGDKQAKSLAQRLETLQTELKEFKEGSPEFVQREKELLQKSSEFEAFRKSIQRDLMRKEAQIYKTIYLEIVDTVQKYAEQFDYTLVLRFTRDGLESSGEPGEVIQRMNQQVVYHRSRNDITAPVLDYLNRKYLASSGKGSTDGSAKRSAGTPRSRN